METNKEKELEKAIASKFLTPQKFAIEIETIDGVRYYDVPGN